MAYFSLLALACLLSLPPHLCPLRSHIRILTVWVMCYVTLILGGFFGLSGGKKNRQCFHLFSDGLSETPFGDELFAVTLCTICIVLCHAACGPVGFLLEVTGFGIKAQCHRFHKWGRESRQGWSGICLAFALKPGKGCLVEHEAFDMLQKENLTPCTDRRSSLP